MTLLHDLVLLSWPVSPTSSRSRAYTRAAEKAKISPARAPPPPLRPLPLQSGPRTSVPSRRRGRCRSACARRLGGVWQAGKCLFARPRGLRDMPPFVARGPSRRPQRRRPTNGLRLPRLPSSALLPPALCRPRRTSPAPVPVARRPSSQSARPAAAPSHPRRRRPSPAALPLPSSSSQPVPPPERLRWQPRWSARGPARPSCRPRRTARPTRPLRALASRLVSSSSASGAAGPSPNP